VATIAILGHQRAGKTTLAQALAAAHAPFAVHDSVDWTQAPTWSGAILVIASDDGPMPGTRSSLETAVRQGVTRVAMFLAKLDLVEDVDLQDLVVLECEELYAKLGPHGAAPPVVRGSAKAALAREHTEIGLPAIQRLVDVIAGWGLR
jgi:elongation factor Tu